MDFKEGYEEEQVGFEYCDNVILSNARSATLQAMASVVHDALLAFAGEFVSACGALNVPPEQESMLDVRLLSAPMQNILDALKQSGGDKGFVHACESLTAYAMVKNPDIYVQKKHEVFMVLFLDAQNRLIVAEEMFRGTLTQTSVYPREVVIRALEHQAASVILSHNHPSGAAQPSRADEALTQTLNQALALVDVRVLDHVIWAAGEIVSMAECGAI